MKKLLVIISALLALAVAGCGGANNSGASGGDTKTLKVGATAVPHAEMLEIVKPILQKDGIKLEIVEFSDYVQPNLALNDKELDANFFQHEQYLTNFVNEHKEVKIKSAAGIHIEPMGIYSKKIQDLKDLPEGATFAVPNDPTNEGRSLKLLAKAGIITLKQGAGDEATVNDIDSNPRNIKFNEVEAAQVPRTLDDVTAAVINTNFAMQVDMTPMKDALFMEDSSSPYVNVIVVRDGDETRPDIQALIKAMKSDEMKKFIEDKYKGAVVPVF